MGIAFRLNDFFKGERLSSFYKEFSQSLHFSKEQLNEYQSKKLKKILRYANDNSPFYRQRFHDYGVNIDTVKSISDISHIPPTTRDDLQIFIDDIKTPISKRKLYHGSSSGSTGVPVHYYHDILGASAGKAALYIGWKLSGWSMRDKGLHVWGNPTVVHESWNTLGSKLKAFVFNQDKYPAFRITQENKFGELVELIKKKRYQYLDGYTNAIYLLADYIRVNNIELPSVKYIITTGETLQDYQRLVIDQALAKTYDMYGCGEINGIAQQCSTCGEYHVIDPHVIVEFGCEKQPDGSYPLFITDLDNYGMPFIRYENGDYGIPGSKNCPCPFSTLHSVNGRTSDVIRFPNGSALSVPSFFGGVLLKKISSIKQYQIVRDEPLKLTIMMVVNKELSTTEKAIITSTLNEYLGPAIKWEIVFTDRIPPSPTGKFKLVLDKCGHQC